MLQIPQDMGIEDDGEAVDPGELTAEENEHYRKLMLDMENVQFDPESVKLVGECRDAMPKNTEKAYSGKQQDYAVSICMFYLDI